MKNPIRPALSAPAAVLAASLILGSCSGGGGGGEARTSPLPDPAASTVSADPAVVPADGAASATITVVVFDDEGVPMPGQTVELAVSGSGNVLTQPTVATDANGVATGSLASTTAELKTVSATINPQTDAVALASTASVDFTAAAVPVVEGFARYEDANGDGRPDQGDTLVVPFSTAVAVSSTVAGDFVMAVDQDTFGVGAIVQAGPAEDEVTITLGDGARVRSRGRFDPASTTANSPSGVDLVRTTASIQSVLSGSPAEPGTPIDVVPVPALVSTLAASGAVGVAVGDISVPVDGAVDVVVATASGVELFTGDGSLGVTAAGRVLADGIRGVRLADLNRFGADEMVTMHATFTQVWNNTSGTFTQGERLASGDARDLAIADLDRNGKPDIVTVSADGLRVFLHLGNLGNSFALPVFARISTVTSVVAADFDGDGDVDVLIGQASANSGRLLRNDGRGALTADGGTLGMSDVVSLGFGDVDGDGDLDVVATRGDESTLLLRNDGSGGFSSSTVAVPGDRVAVVDLDGDSRADLVIGDGDGVSVWFSDREGFVDSGFRAAGGAVTEVVAADLDRDGDADLVVADSGGCGVFGGSLTGTFGTATLSAIDALGADDSRATAVGDVDGDGDLDMVVANDGQNQVWLNDGAGSFTFSGTQGHVLGSGDSRDVVLGDLDQDGDLDAVVANTGAANEVWQNDGAGQFLLGATFAPRSASLCVALARFDDDESLDILVGNDGENQAFRNVSVTGVLAFTEVSAPFSTSGSVDLALETVDLLVFDMDTDGDEDLIVVNQGTELSPQETQVWRKSGALYTIRSQLPAGQVALSGTLGDFDGDGILDLAIGRASPNGSRTVQVYRGLRASLSTLPISVATGAQVEPRALALTDVDGDGIADLVIGNRGAPVEVLTGDGAGGFTSAQTLENDQTTDLAVVDIDRDGDRDLLTTVRNGGSNRVYRNQ